MKINLCNLFNRGETLLVVFLKFELVRLVIKQHGEGFVSVATSTAGFLKIRFKRFREVKMNNKTYIGFINPHPKGVRGYNNRTLPVHPPVLLFRANSGRQPSMIEVGRNLMKHQIAGNFLRLATISDIDNPTPLHSADHLEQTAHFVLLKKRHVGQIRPEKALPKQLRLLFSKFEFLLNITYYSAHGRSGQRQKRNIRMKLA